MAMAPVDYFAKAPLPPPTWQPTPGMTRGQLQSAASELGQYGYTDSRQQLYGRLEPGMAGYDPQKAANLEAINAYGATQGWHPSSGWSSAKNILNVALPAVASWAAPMLANTAAGAEASAGAVPAGTGTVLAPSAVADVAAGTPTWSSLATAPSWQAPMSGVLADVAAGAVPGAFDFAGANEALMGGGDGIDFPAMNAALTAQPPGDSVMNFINSFLSTRGGSAAGPGVRTFGGFTLPEGLSVGAGIYGLTEARRMRKAADAAAAQQDPFASQRAQYGRELADLSADPSRVTKLPGYEFGIEQGREALLRSSAATGFTGSGNEGIALEKFGQQYAGTYLANEQARLASLAGASFPPTGGNTMVEGRSRANDIMNQALKELGYGIGGRVFH